MAKSLLTPEGVHEAAGQATKAGTLDKKDVIRCASVQELKIEVQ